MKIITLLIIFILVSITLDAQTNISGVINNYAPVSATTANTITYGAFIPTVPSFVCGDRVMIIQMKGATINTTNGASFGNVTAINNAGNYEMATILSVSGSVVTLSENLLNSYTTTGLVQLIEVPHYEDATVTATLTAMAWNGTVGGVLAIEVDGTLTLNSDIDVSNQGFRGGSKNPAGTSGDACTFFGFVVDGCVGKDYTYALGSNQAVEKGEGIALFNNSYLKGRGKNANGGGGGGLESGGGGGGSNFGTGGIGGACNLRSCGSGFGCNCTNNGQDVAGLGGLSISNTDRLFLGGGGGAASNGNSTTHYNTPNGNGMKGGGIIVLSANSIIGNSNNINASGESGVISSTIGTMGTGGGGGGGSVHVSASIYSSLTINADGGRGNDSRKQSGSTNNSAGAGGGGGGGRVILNNSSSPSGLTITTAAGSRGLCYDREGDFLTGIYSGSNGTDGTTILNENIPSTTYEPIILVGVTSSASYVVSENRIENFSNSGMLITLGSNSNDLGSTTVTTTIGSNGPFSSTGCSTDEFYLPRFFSIVPTNQPTTDCDVSVYITATELASFISFTGSQSAAYKSCWGEVTGVADLMITAIHSDATVEGIAPTFTYIACSDIFQIDFQVDKFSTFYIHSNKGVTAGNVLPVELLSFNAESLEEDFVSIDWTTVTEINNDGFILERSMDGINFVEITWIEGKGNVSSKSEYFYKDDVSALSFEFGATIYYRLKQIDFDSNFEYSKTISVKRKQNFIVGNLFPNPTGSNSRISISSTSEADCKLEVYSVLGKLIYSDSYQLNSGSNGLILKSEALGKGVYVCYFYIGENKFVKRLIKK